MATSNNTSPLNKIETAHQMYRDGKYEEALSFYTDALFLAKTRPQKIALHSNRAACYLKLHDIKKAAEECTSVLELDHNHTGALMLRAQTLVTLKEYHSALFDVNRLMELNPTSDVYQNLEARLRTQLSLAPIPESEAEFEEEEENYEDEVYEEEEEQQEAENIDNSVDETVQDSKPPINPVDAEITVSQRPNTTDSPEKGKDQKSEPRKTIAAEVIAQAQRKAEPRKTIAAEVIAQSQKTKESSQRQNSKSWQTIPKPKGHSALDYARWDKVIEDDSSEDDDDDDDDEEAQPQYRFRVKTVGVRSVK